MNVSAKRRYLLLVEDDEVSREVLSLQMGAQGYQVDAVDSGDAAVAWLEGVWGAVPDAIVTDLQMPGLSGPELTVRLREIATAKRAKGSSGPVVVAMSASRPAEDLLRGFDGFLLKPFTMAQLAAALETAAGTAAGAESERPTESELAGGDSTGLDEAVYVRLVAAMPATQLQQLYTLFLDDATARMARMRAAAEAGDDSTYRKEAHAIKGGCSMVGAAELHQLASAAEQGGFAAANHVASLGEMLGAVERLRRILRAREDRAAM
jgi:CheY-like chemotaxis protein/HPt (histidine-containing phosphotransfer) domain-containing protein